MVALLAGLANFSHGEVDVLGRHREHRVGAHENARDADHGGDTQDDKAVPAELLDEFRDADLTRERSSGGRRGGGGHGVSTLVCETKL